MRSTCSCCFAVVALVAAACQGRPTTVADAGPLGPALAFVALPASVGCDGDGDADADGFQLEVTVEIIDDDGSGFAQVLVSNSRNNATADGDLGDGPATVRIDAVAGAEPAADNGLTATSTNQAGRTLEVSTVVAVDCAVAPPMVTCAFTAPSDDAVINADNADVVIGCTWSGLNAAQRILVASAQLRVDATAASGATMSQELDLVEGGAAGNITLPSTGTHTLTVTLLDPDDLLEGEPTHTISVDVQPP